MEVSDKSRELELIKEKFGRLHPEDIVSEASSPDHPLHRCFEWDDSAAAHQHRLEQARGIIRSVRIIYNGRERRQFATVEVNQRECTGYEEIAVLLSVKSKREQYIDQFFRRIRGVLREFSALADEPETRASFMQVAAVVSDAEARQARDVAS